MMLRDLFTAIGVIYTIYWLAKVAMDLWFWCRCPEIREYDRELAEYRRQMKRGEI